nr:MAG TPA: hypothetical protein [Caudoviricetes sp.]
MRITRSGEINLLLFAIPPSDVRDNTPRIVIQPVQRLNTARFWKHSAHQRLICNRIIWRHFMPRLHCRAMSLTLRWVRE